MAQIFNKCVALNLNEQKPQAIGNRSEVDFYLQWAARLCGVVAAIYSEIGLEVGPPAQNEFNSAKEEVLARLGQETFARLYTEGQLIPLQEIINTLLLFIGTFVKGATCSS
jgi:hypothetical protein